jgi:hypothetical protein
LMVADRLRYALEYEKLRLQQDANASSIEERRARLEAKRAELKAIITEIDRLTSAEQAGLGRSRELSDFIVRRDEIDHFIRSEESSLLRSSNEDRPRQSSVERKDGDSVILSMLNGRIERINTLRLKLDIIQNRMELRKVVAPCDGRVVDIKYLPGDVVNKFNPILTIEEPIAAFIDVYIPENADMLPQLGQRVAVYPRRSGLTDTRGTIVFIDPGYSAIPQRLAFRNINYWARKFRAKLDNGHGLMPGEAAQVELLNEKVAVDAAYAAEVSSPMPSSPHATAVPPLQTRTKDTLPTINFPTELQKQSVIEPSGIAWLADIERYVIVSDDTGLNGRNHEPWVFLMDRQGRMEPKPTLLSGIAQVNDLESIAPGKDGFLYLVSSQSISKKGKRPESRQQILKVKRSGRDFSVMASVDFLSVLTASYNNEQLRALGLGETNNDGQLVLNIEGSAWFEGDLLLGLKQPRPAQGAIIWRLKNPDRLFERKALDPNQLTIFGHADVRTPDGKSASISDLVVDEHNNLFALSTILKASNAEQVGGMYRLIKTDTDKLQTIPLFSFPQLKPEGICSLGDGHYTIVFDTDGAVPIPYLSVEVPRL